MMLNCRKHTTFAAFMAGIYFHIPFCRKACHYCDFHFSTSDKYVDDMVKAQCMEMEFRRDYLASETLSTIYFGGGTPSVLTGDQLKRYFDRIESLFEIVPGAEITLEANPDDINAEQLRLFREVGINRLSIGVQSFREEDLVFMNRSHRASQSERAVKSAQDAGIENITIDLIYAIPGLDLNDWQENLRRAIALDVPHLSSYCLTIEEKTVFGKRYQRGELSEIDSARAEEQFLCSIEVLGAAGLKQYEVSNFSREGMESRHNTSYWQGKRYLGIGPSAHSFNGSSRSWNVSNNAIYIKGIFSEKPVFESETLNDRTRYNEYIMTSLRTVRGIDSKWIDEQFGISFSKDNEEKISTWMDQGKLIQKDHIFTLSPVGFLWADRIASDFFIV
jgi:oxygen-independent coproporphyrinogen III oxidase